MPHDITWLSGKDLYCRCGVVNQNLIFGLQFRRYVYESSCHRNSGLPAGHADDWSLGATLEGFGGFSSGGQKLRKVLLTGTFCATIVGASSTIGMAGLGFRSGLAGAWWMLSGTIGMLILSLFFAEKIRSKGCYTLPELVGSFYGERVRTAASLLIAVSWVGVIAVQIAAAGKVLSAIFGGDGTIFMIACSLVFVLYTAHGGQSSVVRTDLVQFLIIITGMVILFFAALSSAGAALF